MATQFYGKRINLRDDAEEAVYGPFPSRVDALQATAQKMYDEAFELFAAHTFDEALVSLADNLRVGAARMTFGLNSIDVDTLRFSVYSV